MAHRIKITYQLKRGLAERWNELDPILEQGEPGFEIDTNRLKIGDGETPWTSLPYIMSEVFVSNESFEIAIKDLQEQITIQQIAVNGEIIKPTNNKIVNLDIPTSAKIEEISLSRINNIINTAASDDLELQNIFNLVSYVINHKGQLITLRKDIDALETKINSINMDTILPPVSTTDNGKVLSVVDGSWQTTAPNYPIVLTQLEYNFLIENKYVELSNGTVIPFEENRIYMIIQNS